MTYGELYQRVRRQLNDNITPYRWPDSALRMYSGTVLRRMAEVAPQTMAEIRPTTLDEGALQTVPSWAVRFLGGVRRDIDGKSLRNVSPELMDNVLPGWRDDPPSEYTTDCIYDMSVPGEFGVHPPALEGTVLHIRASVVADDPVAEDEVIPAARVNEIALLHGLLGLCFSEDTDVGDLQLAAQHWGQFYDALGVQRQIDAENPPMAKEDQG